MARASARRTRLFTQVAWWLPPVLVLLALWAGVTTRPSSLGRLGALLSLYALLAVLLPYYYGRFRTDLRPKLYADAPCRVCVYNREYT